VSSALAVANELAARLACDRVSIGFERSGNIDVKAISHTATFDPKMNLARLIGEAMEEVLDLDMAMVYRRQTTRRSARSPMPNWRGNSGILRFARYRCSKTGRRSAC